MLATGSSAAGVAIGANGTWTLAPALVPQLVHWHARATDNLGLDRSVERVAIADDRRDAPSASTTPPARSGC